ncbi:hypothetical protein, partial [Serratia fonticola]|uniref:hypothetical protein n=1 Tax=Serratia fonticola TaxID=47917 RepID=UPI0034C6260F
HTKNRRRGEYKERSTDGDKVQKLPGVCAGEMCIRDSPKGEGTKRATYLTTVFVLYISPFQINSEVRHSSSASTWLQINFRT